MPSIYAIARQRTAQSIERQIIQAMTIEIPEGSPADIKRKKEAQRKSIYNKTEHGRSTVRKAVKKYRQTEKGRENNRKVCKRHYHKNPEKAKARVKAYKEQFKKLYGCNYGSWQYWRKKLVTGQCTESDVPATFIKALEAFKNGVFNRHKESE